MNYKGGAGYITITTIQRGIGKQLWSNPPSAATKMMTTLILTQLLIRANICPNSLKEEVICNHSNMAGDDQAW